MLIWRIYRAYMTINVNTSDKTLRAGRYIKQSTGYSAFVPQALPPKPALALDDPELLTLLSKADRALGRLDGSTDILPNPDLFVAMYVRKEAVLSSQIEGTQASLNDVLENEAHAPTHHAPADVDEVVNYVKAMNHGLERLSELPVSLRLIRDIHRELMTGVRGGDQNPGAFRTSQNWIGPPGCMLNDASFVPPPPAEIMKCMGDLENFIHSPEPMPVLIKVGLTHGQFETIHPFLDGNGRVGRLLITFLLCERDILNRPLLYLSHFFKQHREAYYEHLQRIRHYGEWEEWLKFFLRGVAEVSAEATETARRIVQLREHHRLIITRHFGRAAANATVLVENLYRQPIVTVTQVQHIIGQTYQSANRMVDRFVELSLLEEITGGSRNRRFRYKPYIDLFAEHSK